MPKFCIRGTLRYVAEFDRGVMVEAKNREEAEAIALEKRLLWQNVPDEEILENISLVSEEIISSEEAKE